MEFKSGDYVVCKLFDCIARIEVMLREAVIIKPVAYLKGSKCSEDSDSNFQVHISQLEELTLRRLKEIRQVFAVEIDDTKSLIKFDKELDYKEENTYDRALSYLCNYKGSIYAIIDNEGKKVEYCTSESISLENYNYVVIPYNKIKIYKFKQYYWGTDIGQGIDYSGIARFAHGCVTVNPTANASIEYKDINDVNKKEMSSLIEDINKILFGEGKEENKMNEPIKVFGRTNLSKLIIDENNRKVTALCNEGTSDKKATVAVQSKDDKFDKYVGAALAIAYQFFGSKGEFRKFVDEQAQDLKKIAEEKAARKKQHLAEMEKAKAKKAEREAKKKELPEPTDEQIAAFLKKLFGKEYKKQIKKSK